MSIMKATVVGVENTRHWEIKKGPRAGKKMATIEVKFDNDRVYDLNCTPENVDRRIAQLEVFKTLGECEWVFQDTGFWPENDDGSPGAKKADKITWPDQDHTPPEVAAVGGGSSRPSPSSSSRPPQESKSRGSGKSYGGGRDETATNKRTALMQATEYFKMNGDRPDREAVMALADDYFRWMEM